jgi:hypothetical protein
MLAPDLIYDLQRHPICACLHDRAAGDISKNAAMMEGRRALAEVAPQSDKAKDFVELPFSRTLYSK